MRIVSGSLRCFASFIGSLPLSEALGLGEIFGWFAYYLFHRRTRIALDNLRAAFKTERYPGEFKRIAKKMWRNLGRNIIEFLHLQRYTRQNIDHYVRFDDFHKVLELKNQGRGVLVLTAHLGNWDLLALSCGLKGVTVNLVTKRLRSKFLDQFWQTWRKGGASEIVNPIFKKGAAKQVLQKLREGELVAFVLDQHAKRKEGAVLVDFFGRKAATLSILAVLSRKHGVPVLPAFIVRTSRARHRVFLEEPLYFEEMSNPEESMRHNTQRYSDIIEKYVRAYPEQWTWIHRRWKAAKGTIQESAISKQ
jgi:KDO2-lipid IV(A) lauroyltransferase